MNHETEQKRRQLMRDAQEIKLWHKLYKSGSKWVTATIGVTTLGLVLLSTTAQADTTGTTLATTTTNMSTTLDNSSPGSSDTATSMQPQSGDTQAITETKTSEANPVNTPSSGVTTTANEPTTSQPQSESIDQSLDQSATNGQTVSDPAKNTPSNVVSPATTNSLGSSAKVNEDSNQTGETAVSSDLAPTAKPAEPNTITDTASTRAITAAPSAPLALATAPTTPSSVISAPEAMSMDITSSVKFPQFYGVTSISDGSTYTYAQQSDGTWVSTGKNAPTTNNWRKPSFFITATNTRTDGFISYLTAASVVTFNLPVQSPQLPFTVDALPALPYIWINGSTVTGDADKTVTNESIFPNGNVTSGGQVATITTNAGRLNQPLTGSLTVSTSGITDDGAVVWLAFRDATNTQYRLIIGYLATQTFQLAPMITDWQANNPIMSGTAVGVGNTITVKSTDGSVNITTTVDDNGKWAVNLTGVDQAKPLYVVESNNLGDLPGVAAATQFATATRNINYVTATGTDLGTPITQTLSVQRQNTATIDPVTQKVTWQAGEWVASSSVDQFPTASNPVITGYYTDSAQTPAISITDLNLVSTGLTLNTNIVYQPLATWELQGADLAPISYVNDPNDPTGILPPTSPEVPPIPYVPGYSPYDSNIKILKQIDVNDLTKGYLPPVPISPGTPTLITYRPVLQRLVLFYQDVTDPDNPIELLRFPSIGFPGTIETYKPTVRIAEFISQGYVLQSNNYPASGAVFDYDSTVDQTFQVNFTHGTAVFSPNNPGQPGQLVDPDNPNGPKWPSGTDDISNLQKNVTQTINFIDSDTGDLLLPAVTNTLAFERTATVDLVTGEITPAATWTVTSKNSDGSDDTTFDEVPSPWIKGYIADQSSIAAITDITAATQDQNATILYSKVSAWTTTEPGLKDIDYVVDPAHPDQLLPTTDDQSPVMPFIAGKTPYGPDGAALTPVDLNNLQAGYILPAPVDPVQPTAINYVPDTQRATVTYQDVQTGTPVTLGIVDQLSGSSASTSDYSTADRIKALVSQGYVLKANNFPTDGLVFDTDASTDQVFVITFTHGETIISSTAPGKPGQLIDTANPDGPKWPANTDDVTALSQTVTRTVNYVDAGTGDALSSSNVSEVTFERTATVDLVTGTITPAPTWTVTSKTPDGLDDTTFEAVASPWHEGYLVDQLAIAEKTGITPTDTDIVETVLYTKVGAWTSTDDNWQPIDYLVDANQPNALLPVTDAKVPAIPFIPGKTPVGPDGQPLVVKNPAHPEAGYLPPEPVDPTKPTLIDYVADTQQATVTYLDVNDTNHPAVLGDVDQLSGPSESTSQYTTAERIKALLAQGYVLVSDEYPADGLVFDKDTNHLQTIVVSFKHGQATISPAAPGKPGQPVDATNPDGSKWPDGTDDTTALQHTVTETIHYVAADTNTSLAQPHVNQISFESTATVDLVTGAMTPSGKWTVSTNPTSDGENTTFEAVKSPFINGYIAEQPAIAAISDVTHTTADIEKTVTYAKVSAWQITGANLPQIDYVVDPDHPDMLLPTTNAKSPVLLSLAGQTPFGPDDQALTLIDPKQPTSGYQLPTPVDPTKPTLITYVADQQTATVTYQDVQAPAHPLTLGKVDQLTGDSASTSSYTTAARIADLISQGYILKVDGYPASGATFDQDTSVDQPFLVTFTHGVATISPDKPGLPGELIDPNQPNSPKWPAGSDNVTALKQTVTRTIQYVEAGTNTHLLLDNTDSIVFETAAQIDLVTGRQTVSANWMATSKNDDGTADTTFDAVSSPYLKDYLVDRVSVAEKTGIQVTDTNTTETVTYTKVSAWVPSDPSLKPIDYVVDENHPDALLPVTDPQVPVIPYLPGKTPVDPAGKPLSPINPEKPEQGYFPPTPVDPTQPTPINYIADTQHATVTYQDVQQPDHPIILGNIDQLSGESDSSSPYTPADRIAALLAQGYELASNTFPTDGLIFDHDTANNQGYVITFTHGQATITPQAPGRPGAPIDATNPTGPKWPTGTDIVTNLTKTVTKTINYVDANTAEELFKPHTDTIQFESSAVVDLVTGKITPTNKWTVVSKQDEGTNDNQFDAVTSPFLTGYLIDQPVVAATPGVTSNTADQQITVNYQKVGAWTTTEPGVAATDYVVDPKHPDAILPVTDPQSPVMPSVLGKTPTGPDGEPLTPVDSKNLTAGFIPPTPIDPTQPTVITYVADSQKATVIYQDINDSDNPITLGNVVELNGVSGGKSDYTTTKQIQALIAQGYVLKTDNYPADGLIFDQDRLTDQNFTVTFTHGTVLVSVTSPGKPGELVDPAQPTGPNWPADSDKVDTLTKLVTETITYVDSTGHPLIQPHTETITFTRDGTVDLVTGQMTPSLDWHTTDDTTFQRVVNPVITGYFTNQPAVDAVTDITVETANISTQVVYSPLGQWLISEAGLEPIVYPNHATDASQLLDLANADAPVIPCVAGKTPVGPDNQSLTPKDADDPTQGYLPPTPVALGSDTVIMYVADATGGETTPDPGTDSGTDTKPESGTDGGTDTKPEPGTDGETDTKPDTGTDGGTDTKPEPGTDGSTDTKPEPGTDGETDTKPDTGTDGGTDTKPKPGTDGGTDTKPEPGTDGETDTNPNPGTDGGTDTKPDTGSGGNTDTKPEPGTNGETDTTPGPDTDGGTDTNPNPGTDSGTDTKPTPGINGPDGETGTKPTPGIDNGNNIKPEPGSGSGSGTNTGNGGSPAPSPGTGGTTTPIPEPEKPTTVITSQPKPKVPTVTAPTKLTTPTKSAVQHKTQTTLPQTDEQSSFWATLGISLLSLVGLTGILSYRRKKE